MTGIVDTKDACMPEASLFSITSPFAPGSETLNIGSLFGGDPWGIAAAMLSVLTNIAATILIAYRAWYVSSFDYEGALVGSLTGVDVLVGNTGS